MHSQYDDRADCLQYKKTFSYDLLGYLWLCECAHVSAVIHDNKIYSHFNSSLSNQLQSFKAFNDRLLFGQFHCSDQREKSSVENWFYSLVGCINLCYRATVVMSSRIIIQIIFYTIFIKHFTSGHRIDDKGKLKLLHLFRVHECVV